MSDSGRPRPSGSWDPSARPARAPRDPEAAGPAHAAPRPATPPPPDPAALRPATGWGVQPPARPAAQPPTHGAAQPPAQGVARPPARGAAEPPAHGPAQPTPQGPAQPNPRPAPAPQRAAGPLAPPAWRSADPSPFPAGPGATAAASAGPSDAAPDAPPAHAAADRRPAWLLPVAIGAGVLVVAGVVAGVLLTRDGAETPAATATTVVLPSPTPTVAPVPREATTAFASALPTSVLEYALASSAPDEEWVAAGALEAWTETYTDGADGLITVRAAQFETPEEAATFAGTLTAALPPAPVDATSDPGEGTETPELPQSGEVEAGDAVVGTYTVVDAGDGTGLAVWQNGTAVLHMTVPVDDAAAAYAAFPL